MTPEQHRHLLSNLWDEYNRIADNLKKVDYLLANPYELRKGEVYQKIYEMLLDSPEGPYPIRGRQRYITGQRYRVCRSSPNTGKKNNSRLRNRSKRLSEEIFEITQRKKTKA